MKPRVVMPEGKKHVDATCAECGVSLAGKSEKAVICSNPKCKVARDKKARQKRVAAKQRKDAARNSAVKEARKAGF